MLIGGETENLSWTQKPPTRFVIETSQLITLAVCCGYVSNLIGRRTINIPEIILGVHGLMGFTVNCIFLCIKLLSFYFVSFVVIFIFSVFLPRSPQAARRTPTPRFRNTRKFCRADNTLFQSIGHVSLNE